ncbi:hypothetical protein HDU93_002955 [Gonapodya sp. JEL0774]|nr:hypothetical protein HDU93_002955 [Gonapodya sp. JEL0774]
MMANTSPPRSPIAAGSTGFSPYWPGEQLSGSFVGSYEESLLSRRLSTRPSPPLPFSAVLGSSSSHPSVPAKLRCTRQTTIEFNAVFYELAKDGMGGGTPYVGQWEVVGKVSKKDGAKVRKSSSKQKPNGADDMEEDGEVYEGEGGEQVTGYRLPAVGQLQVIIKNPSLTAVKVFLIPYDYRSMPPLHRTFLRQKSYAIPGTVVAERPATMVRPTVSKILESSSPISSGGAIVGSPPTKGPMRYAIHVQFATDSRGRLFLWRNVRVVFSHGGEGGGEKLRVVYEGAEGGYVPIDFSRPTTPISVSGPSRSFRSRTTGPSGTGSRGARGFPLTPVKNGSGAEQELPWPDERDEDGGMMDGRGSPARKSPGRAHQVTSSREKSPPSSPPSWRYREIPPPRPEFTLVQHQRPASGLSKVFLRAPSSPGSSAPGSDVEDTSFPGMSDRRGTSSGGSSGPPSPSMGGSASALSAAIGSVRMRGNRSGGDEGGMVKELKTRVAMMSRWAPEGGMDALPMALDEHAQMEVSTDNDRDRRGDARERNSGAGSSQQATTYTRFGFGGHGGMGGAR